MARRTSTAPPDSTSSTAVDTAIRFVALALTTSVVLAGITGAIGVRSRTAVATSGDLELTARYGQLVRPGLASPFEIVVRTTGSEPLPAELRVEVSASYLAMFDENGFEPEPSEAWSRDGRVIWTYDVPDGERELVISLDARIEPAVQMSRRTAVITVQPGAAGSPLSVDITSWVLP